MGILGKLFGGGSGDSSNGLATLKSLGYELSAEEKQKADEALKALKSKDWRDWEKACPILGRLRIDSAIPAINKVLFNKVSDTTPNIAMFSLATVFQIGGEQALKQFRHIAKIPEKYSIQSAPVKKWAHVLATVLEHLKSRVAGSDKVKDAVFSYLKSEQLPENLRISDLWAVSAAAPGLITACMQEMCNRLEEKISNSEDLSPEDIKFAKEFGIIASCISTTYMQMSPYDIGYFCHYDFCFTGLKARVLKTVHVAAEGHSREGLFDSNKYYDYPK